MIHQYKHSYGVQYQSAREGVAKYYNKGNRIDGFTIRRMSPRVVELKREARNAKKKPFLQ